jgi:hypothetical protein
MKFLMLSKLLLEVPPPEDFPGVIQAAKEYLNTAVAEGWLDCIYMYADGRQAVLIANADSHEELCDWLQANPAYPNWDYEIHPLVDLNHYLDTITAGMY